MEEKSLKCSEPLKPLKKMQITASTIHAQIKKKKKEANYSIYNSRTT